MKTNIISRKYGWYLARVNASIENFANIVATSSKVIRKYNLQPGRYIKINSFSNTHSNIDFLDKFILLPYFSEIIENYWLLQQIIQSFTKETYQYVDKEYFNTIIKLISTFYHEKSFVLKELLEFDIPENYHMDIALPDSWLNEHNVDLGDTVLLRNDEPSPVIL
ncbi:MAG: hypothetical protein ACXAC5_15005 [Promethearchaeota archaeon]